MKPIALYFSLLTLLALLVACESQEQTPSSKGRSVTDYDSLVESLQDEGAAVELTGNVTQPFFTPQGQVITIDGQDVQVFEYASVADADSEAALVSPDGSSVGTSMMTWIATPHFYDSGKLIVIYVGDQNNTIVLLESSLGFQFAGD